MSQRSVEYTDADTVTFRELVIRFTTQQTSISAFVIDFRAALSRDVPATRDDATINHTVYECQGLGSYFYPSSHSPFGACSSCSLKLSATFRVTRKLQYLLPIFSVYCKKKKRKELVFRMGFCTSTYKTRYLNPIFILSYL